MQAGIYLRISKGDEDQTATIRQRQDCEAYCTKQGWEIRDVYEDVDLSAYNRKVNRPGYDRLIKAVGAHEVDVVVAWHVDRLSRQQSSFVRLMDALEDSDAFLVGVTDGVDTRQETGRFIADLLVSHARMSSADASRRLKRKHEELARDGKLAGYGRRSFGYRFDREARELLIVEDEAAEIREAVQRILVGETVRTVLKDWVSRGIHAPGGRWQQTNFRAMLTSARISGQREYGGILTQGNWPAIITPEETYRLRYLLRNGKQISTARRYLLSGFCRCGKCGARMESRPDSRSNRRYVCARQVDGDNCGAVARQAEPVENLVKEAVCIALDDADLAAYIKQPSDHTGELIATIEADEQALKELSQDYYVDKRISRVEFFNVRDALDARIEAARGKLAQTNGHGVLNGFVGTGTAVREQWESLNLDKRRAIISAVIDHVDILPAIKGSRLFDPSLVHIVWKF